MAQRPSSLESVEVSVVIESTRDRFWRDKCVLVTGASGFVGSWLTHALVDYGACVTVIVRDQVSRNNFDLLDLNSRVNIVHGSITDFSVVQRAINEYEVDTCFHLAAQSLVVTANRSPLSTFEANIQGTWLVLEACRASQQVKRVVLASSDKAYGSQPTLPYRETMPLLGINPYDASKACADILARSYHHTFTLPVAVARCANIYGGGDLNFSRLIPGTVRSVLAGQPPIIRSDGTPVREYVFIEDVVAGYLTLAEQLGRADVGGEAFNFGADRHISAIDLTRQILAACDREDLEPDVRGSGKLHTEIDRQYLDSSKAAKVLGWTSRVPLEEGLRRTIDWYVEYFKSAPEIARAGVVASR